MVSGPDVITYFGVPIAVLGVAPIIYNTCSTLVTLAKVRRALRHGRLAGITRGDIVNHVIEVELPRYTIAPLHREEHSAEYWSLSRHPSEIPGGTWTTFNWKCHAIGLKTQRIDYADQLRQPQAEIGFEELVSFLLDLGGVPDPVGFRMLRASGLWVPVGTVLLRSPNEEEAVLFVAPLDDSDGNLSLSVRWSSDWGMRDPASLPPYWVLIKGAGVTVESVDSTTKNETQNSDDVTEKGEMTAGVADPVENQPKEDDEVCKTSKTDKYIPDAEDVTIDLRCQIGSLGITTAIPDSSDSDLFDEFDIQHLEVSEVFPNTTGTWFASTITALGTTSQTVLWSYKISPEILSFAKKDTIPCGIMVLLSVVAEDLTPEWSTQYNDAEEEREASFRQMRENSRALMNETSLSPADRAKAAAERQMRTHDQYVDKMNAKRRRDAQRAETRIVEALQSPKWNASLVANHFLGWLKEKGHVQESHDLRRAVEVTLWRMVCDASYAAEIGSMLDSWKRLVDDGGMRKADYLALKGDLVPFAFASLMVAVIANSVTAASGSLAVDLQECVRVWKKVRLG
ncbi:hypothetical protein GLAREA_04561 [Glarea lozoyensis ATCC 20868]|uniref:Uncharacterized protein n=1 Tax=Glarea lozoyensis (strain ATCC 20868 / MF5171) TaxID=1116229 RepID=S3CQ23_GLAL2|nr:uncharacterized protein GLAREA_04561 [Glarea lozoyensis ATCC 20868]EPE27770.1 hypothetical protein GLAREA_04561 [Glarea lozoyensis ATCC 20868]